MSWRWASIITRLLGIAAGVISLASSGNLSTLNWLAVVAMMGCSASAAVAHSRGP